MELGSKTSHYWDQMYRMRLSGTLCDIHLSAKNEQDNMVSIPAHKTVLIASSLYFAELMETNSIQNIYNFDGVSLLGLRKMLDYIYRQIQWSELIKLKEAELIANTLKLVRHDPFDAPSAGVMLTNKDGSNIMLMEKIRHSSRPKSLNKPTKQKRSTTKVFHTEKELQEALAMHKMSTAVGRGRSHQGIQIIKKVQTQQSQQQFDESSQQSQFDESSQQSQQQFIHSQQVGEASQQSQQSPTEVVESFVHVSEEGGENGHTGGMILSEDGEPIYYEVSVGDGDIVEEGQMIDSGEIIEGGEEVEMMMVVEELDEQQQQQQQQQHHQHQQPKQQPQPQPQQQLQQHHHQQHTQQQQQQPQQQHRQQPQLQHQQQQHEEPSPPQDDLSQSTNADKQQTTQPQQPQQSIATTIPPMVSSSSSLPKTSTPPAKVLVKVEQPPAEVDPFPSGSTMDLLASASEMVQRQSVGETLATTDKETEDQDEPESKQPVMLDHVTGQIIQVPDAADATPDHMENEDIGRRSKRVSKRKDVVETFLSSARKRFQKEGVQSPKQKLQPKEVDSVYEDLNTSTEENVQQEQIVDESSQKENSELQKEITNQKESEQDKQKENNEQTTENTNKTSPKAGLRKVQSFQVVQLKVEDKEKDEEEEEKTTGEDSEKEGSKPDPLKDLRASIRVVKETPNSHQEITHIARPGRPPGSSKVKTQQTPTDYRCELCNKYFVNIIGYKNHMSYMHGGIKVHPEDGRSYACDMCTEETVFSTFAALASHARMTHPENCKNYVCGECDGSVQFKYHRDLKHHMVKEHKFELWFCDLCQKSFQSREGHKIHMFKQHSGAPPSNICEICGKGFVREQELRSHVKVTHSDERAYKCLVCEAADQHNAFKTNNALRRHIQTVHTSTRDFCCNMCDAVFKTRTDMLRHREKHLRSNKPIPYGARKKENSSGGAYICDICSRVYKNSASLATHQRVQHVEKGDNVTYMCTFCPKSFAVKQYLLMHLRNIHEPKKYRCEACGQTFAQRYEVKRHAPKCRGYPIDHKPYGCVQCGKTFTLKGNLTKHLASTCKGRRRENDVDFVLMMQKEEGEEEEDSRQSMDENMQQTSMHQESSGVDFDESVDDDSYVITSQQEQEEEDNEAAAIVAAAVEEERGQEHTEVMIVKMETRNEHGQIVYKPVPIIKQSPHTAGGQNIVDLDEFQGQIVQHGDIMTSAAGASQHSQLVPLEDIIEGQQHGVSVDCSAVAGQQQEQDGVIISQGQIEVEVTEDGGEVMMMEVEGYEVSQEEMIGVHEALESQGMQIIQTTQVEEQA